jgi:methionyl-tRNA formyltransferase
MHKPFLYFGTPYVASDTLAELLQHGYTPRAVVTSPDAPRGRGLELAPSPVKALAIERGIEVLTPERIDADVIATLKEYGAEYAVVVAYGKILPQALIDAFPLGILNIHYSLLPKYRGASPVEAALLHGDAVTGVTIQKMVFKLDAGDVIAQKEVSIGATETAKELKPRLIKEGAELLIQTLPAFEDGSAVPVVQDESQATHCGKMTKEDGLIMLTDDARTNWNKYRAYAEWPTTYFFTERNGKQIRVKITKATFTNGKFYPERVVPEGKKEMNWADFSRN